MTYNPAKQRTEGIWLAQLGRDASSAWEYKDASGRIKLCIDATRHQRAAHILHSWARTASVLAPHAYGSSVTPTALLPWRGGAIPRLQPSHYGSRTGISAAAASGIA